MNTPTPIAALWGWHVVRRDGTQYTISPLRIIELKRRIEARRNGGAA